MQPGFVDERDGARFLGLKPKDFLRLVDAGALPDPYPIGEFKRWDVEELRRIARGDAAKYGRLDL